MISDYMKKLTDNDKKLSDAVEAFWEKHPNSSEEDHIEYFNDLMLLKTTGSTLYSALNDLREVKELNDDANMVLSKVDELIKLTEDHIRS